MDAEAAKYIGAGLATLGMIGSAVGVGNIFGQFRRAPCATRRPLPVKSATCSSAPPWRKPWASWPSCWAS